MKSDDWCIRLKGKHSITVYNDGNVYYSIGKKRLFILKKQALQEIKSLISDFDPSDSSNDIKDSNVLKYNDGKSKISIYNSALYTKIWKMIYNENNIKQMIPNLDTIVNEIEYSIIYGDIVSDYPLDVIDDTALDIFLDIHNDDEIILSLVNIILTKSSKIYYNKESGRYSNV